MWGFVAKKEAHCDRSDPAADPKGDYWDHVAYDPEHRLIVSVVPGARTSENRQALVGDCHRRTGGRLMNLMTSNGYGAYESPILHAYGETITPPRVRASQAAPAGLTCAVVDKVQAKEGWWRSSVGWSSAPWRR